MALSCPSLFLPLYPNRELLIVDLPGNVNAVAASLVANATGTVKASYTVLITPEEVDETAAQGRQLAAAYRAPGQ